MKPESIRLPLRWAAFIVLLLAALSPMQIYYAQEVRGYMTSIMFSAFAVWGLMIS